MQIKLKEHHSTRYADVVKQTLDKSNGSNPARENLCPTVWDYVSHSDRDLLGTQKVCFEKGVFLQKVDLSPISSGLPMKRNFKQNAMK